MLVEKIPGISQEEMNYFRETICGKINSEIKNSKLLALIFGDGKDIDDVVAINNAQNSNTIQEQP